WTMGIGPARCVLPAGAGDHGACTGALPAWARATAQRGGPAVVRMGRAGPGRRRGRRQLAAGTRAAGLAAGAWRLGDHRVPVRQRGDAAAGLVPAPRAGLAAGGGRAVVVGLAGVRAAVDARAVARSATWRRAEAGDRGDRHVAAVPCLERLAVRPRKRALILPAAAIPPAGGRVGENGALSTR